MRPLYGRRSAMYLREISGSILIFDTVQSTRDGVNNRSGPRLRVPLYPLVRPYPLRHGVQTFGNSFGGGGGDDEMNNNTRKRERVCPPRGSAV